jgi:hypothetical protein
MEHMDDMFLCPQAGRLRVVRSGDCLLGIRIKRHDRSCKNLPGLVLSPANHNQDDGLSIDAIKEN